MHQALENHVCNPGGMYSLIWPIRDTLFFGHLGLRENKMQTAVINIRKYKRILYFLMFITTERKKAE